MFTRPLLSSAAVALMLAVPAVGSAQTMPTKSAAHQLSKPDLNFAKEAATGGMAEVELGKLAQQNAQDDKVKQFGARMVQDHGMANQQLQTIATEKGLDLPQQLDKKHEQLRDRLAKLHGAAFDRAYMAAMVKDHNADLAAFRHEAQSAKDPDIKQFATKTLSVIGQHDKMAKDIDHSLTATGSSRPPR